MKLRLSTAAILPALALYAGMAVVAHAADPIGSSIRLQAETDRAALRSQAHIDQVYDETQALLQEYRRATRELESLRSYDDHLERMVQAQQRAIAALDAQLDQVQVTQRGVIPLVADMVATLGRFVELDTPFLLDERRQRISRLQELLDRPDASVAEKYRRVMEAYQVETAYGRTVEAYRGTLRAGGAERTVDFLRVGRIALLYRSLDGVHAGRWDPQTKSWQALPPEYQSALKQGLRVAAKQIAPELLILPVQAPEVAP